MSEGLSAQGRQTLDLYLNAWEASAGVSNIAKEFSTPVRQIERIESEVLNNSVFLKQCVTYYRPQIIGEKAKFGIEGNVFKRTYVTETVKRTPKANATFNPGQYHMCPIEADFSIGYDKVDEWAMMGPKVFERMIAKEFAKAIANSRQDLAFNGIERQDLTDTGGVVSDPYKVDRGWIKRLEDDNPERIMSEVVPGSGKVFIGDRREFCLDSSSAVDIDSVGVGNVGTVGLPAVGHGFVEGAQITISGTTSYNGTYLVLDTSADNQIHISANFQTETFSNAVAKVTQIGDYLTHGALVSDMKNTIDRAYRDDLKAITSDDILSEREYGYYSNYEQPTEEQKIRSTLASMGPLPSVKPNYIPDETLIVTPTNNLAFYVHTKWRSSIKDTDEDNAVNFYNRFNQDIQIQDVKRILITQNIKSIVPNRVQVNMTTILSS